MTPCGQRRVACAVGVGVWQCVGLGLAGAGPSLPACLVWRSGKELVEQLRLNLLDVLRRGGERGAVIDKRSSKRKALGAKAEGG